MLHITYFLSIILCFKSVMWCGAGAAFIFPLLFVDFTELRSDKFSRKDFSGKERNLASDWWAQIISTKMKCRLRCWLPQALSMKRNTGIDFFLNRYTAHLGLGLILYLYSITVGSAAPQATLWGGLGPRFKLGTGDLEARTLTTRPPLK